MTVYFISDMLIIYMAPKQVLVSTRHLGTYLDICFNAYIPYIVLTMIVQENDEYQWVGDFSCFMSSYVNTGHCKYKSYLSVKDNLLISSYYMYILKATDDYLFASSY